ncbi:hypothetical protein J4Q44_G00154730 [Coregonus suidteri]|uniref:Uncharacterized protein n=1 Tax=Coregonus suidteri TaxID=861788 RepID=A0AAN8QRV5_9TELE
MEAQDRPQPGTKPSTNRVRPGKGDVKVSVVNMCGHSSSSILGKLYQQTALPSNSQYPVQRSKPWPYAPHLMALAPVPVTPRPLLCSIRTSRGTESTTPTTAGTPHSSARERQDRSRVWPCGQRLRGSLRPLCIVESAPEVCAVHCSTIRW